MKRTSILIAIGFLLAGFAAGWFVHQRVATRRANELRLAHELDAAAQASIALEAIDRSDFKAAANVLEGRLASAVDRSYELSRGSARFAEIATPNLAEALRRASDHAERSGRVGTAARARALAAKLGAP